MFWNYIRYFLFSILSVVSGVSVLRLLDFPWGLSLLFEFRFFSSASASYSQFSFLLYYSGMLTSCFPRIFWVSLNLCGLLFLRFRLWLHLFFAFWSSLFRMLRFGLVLAVFLSVFSTCCGYGWLFLFFLRVFPPAAVLAVPSCFSPPFQSVVALPVLWSSSRFFRILRLRLLFAFGTPLIVFRAAGSPLAVPRLSGCCFLCFSASFLSPGFLRLLHFSSLSLGLHSLPWCLFLLVFVVVCFAPALVLSPPVLPCYDAVALWLSVFWLVRISGSRRDRVSLRDESGWLRPLFFSVSSCLPLLVSFLFCLRSVPLPCSHLGFSSWRVLPVGYVFPWCSVSFSVGSFLGVSCSSSFV